MHESQKNEESKEKERRESALRLLCAYAERQRERGWPFLSQRQVLVLL